MRIRLAVLGTGFIANSNVKGALATGDYEIVALCNRTLSKGEAFRDRYQLSCPVFSDYRVMADSVNYDAVLIETPHDLHDEPFCFFAERKKNIIIEKPLAHNYAAAQRMVAAEKQYGIRATVCQTQRYNPILVTAKQFLDTHDTGKLISVGDVITYHYFWDGRPQWFLQAERAGAGIIMNYGVHQLDRIHFLTGGHCDSLYAHVETEKEGVSVDSSYHMTCLSGASQVWQVTCTGYTNPFNGGIELRFTKGILRIKLFPNTLDKAGVFWGTTEQDFTEIPNVCPDADPYQTEMQDAADYLLGRRDDAPISVSYAARMVQLVECAIASSANNQVILTP